MNDVPHSPAPVIPDHQLVRLIGEGSYGEVWLANNVIGTHRAVKVVYRAKFQDARPYEREFKGIQKFEPISRSHPGLVDILQIGRDDDAGYFYYVMELADDEVSGAEFHPHTYSSKTLSREIKTRGRLPATEALQIGMNLAAALAHMHKAGLVHRDIKPSNIIFVGGQPKLADIGLVVSLAEARTFVGTEGYIPPEGPGTMQADIFSLGKVLYEISTGQDRESFPELPNGVSSFPDREIVSELNEIVVKACANTPQARYDSAEQLRADLEMLLAGGSVRHLRFVERQLKRARRLAVAAVFIAVAAGIFAAVITRIRNREKELLARAYAINGAVLVEDGNLHAALPFFAEAWRLQKHRAEAVEANQVRVGSVLQQSPRLLQFWEHEAAVSDLRFSADGQRLLVAGGKIARFVEIDSGASGRSFSTGRTLRTAALSPDGTRIAIANGHFVTMMNALSGEMIFDRETHGSIHSAEFSPDGKTLLLACSHDCAHFMDAATGKTQGEDLNGHTFPLNYASFSPDGTMAVTASQDGTARIWDVKTRRELAVLRQDQWVHDAAFSPDGQRVVTVSSDHTILIWEISPEPKVVCRMEHRGGVHRARFSPDGRWVVSASFDHTVRLWDSNTGKPAGATINMHMPALHAVFSPEGRRVAIAGQDGQIRLWDARGNAPLNVGAGVMAANGERYVTWVSNSFRVWNARDDSPVADPVSVAQPLAGALASADARTIAVVCKAPSNDSTVYVYTGSPGDRPARSFTMPPANGIVLSPDGATLLMTNRKSASLWTTATGQLLFGPAEYRDSIFCVAFRPDSRAVAIATRAAAFVLDARTGVEMFPPLNHPMEVSAMAFAHDGSKLVTATADGTLDPGAVYVWNARTGEPLTNTAPHSDGVRDVRFTREDSYVASAGEDGYAAVWDARTTARRFHPVSLLWQMLTVDISANDRWVMGTSWYGAQVWDMAAGLALTPVLTAPGVFRAGGFCAKDKRVWVRSDEGLLFWDLPRSAVQPDEVFALASQFGAVIPAGLQWNSAALPLAKLRERCAAERARTQAGLESWHRQQSRLYERGQDWFAAQFHLEQLLKLVPNEESLRARLEIARSHRTNSSPILPATAAANPSL